ncbi:PHO2 Acid phosphatase [Candida maltosa Xu316]
MRLLVAFCLLASVHSLNILISNADHWVAKNPRYLKSYLTKKGHTVKLISSISDSDSMPLSSENTPTDGPFHHLLPVHQSYYKHLLNLKRPKHVVIPDKVVQTSQFGQDPLDSDSWYVNSSPLNALQVILPNYYPDFEPDLVIIGPNEGWENQYLVESMMKSVEGVSVLAVSTEDAHDVYYLDERYFHVSDSYHRQLKKHNVFTKNIKSINKSIGKIINAMDGSEAVSAHVKFPSYNHHDSQCVTSHKSETKFKQVHSTRVDAPKYKLNFKTERDGNVVKIVGADTARDGFFKETHAQKLLSESVSEETLKGLMKCKVVLEVHHGKINL